MQDLEIFQIVDEKDMAIVVQDMTDEDDRGVTHISRVTTVSYKGLMHATIVVQVEECTMKKQVM